MTFFLNLYILVAWCSSSILNKNLLYGARKILNTILKTEKMQNDRDEI